MINCRKLSLHARDNPCIKCGAPNQFGISHYNGYRSHSYGKGRGIKANHLMTADFCHNCDAIFSEKNYADWDNGSKSIDRSEQFLHYIAMTNIRRHKNNLFK